MVGGYRSPVFAHGLNEGYVSISSKYFNTRDLLRYIDQLAANGRMFVCDKIDGALLLGLESRPILAIENESTESGQWELPNITPAAKISEERRHW